MEVFKESGEIEYSADIAGVLTTNKEASQINDKREIELNIIKNRNGERAIIAYTFYPKTSKFVERNKYDYEEMDSTNNNGNLANWANKSLPHS